MVNIISAILERMEDHIQELLALGISTEEKKGIEKIRLGCLEGSSEPKRWIWALFSDEREKG